MVVVTINNMLRLICICDHEDADEEGSFDWECEPLGGGFESPTAPCNGINVDLFFSHIFKTSPGVLSNPDREAVN